MVEGILAKWKVNRKLNLNLNHVFMIRLTNLAATAAPTATPTATPTLAPKCTVPGPADFPAPDGGSFDHFCKNFATPRAGKVCDSKCLVGYTATGDKPHCEWTAAVAGATIHTATFHMGNFTCVPKVCTCPNGVPHNHLGEAGRCNVDGMNHCHKCDEHYHKDDDKYAGPTNCVANPKCGVARARVEATNISAAIPATTVWKATDCTTNGGIAHPFGTLKADQAKVICRDGTCNWMDCCEIKTCGGNAAREAIVKNPVCDFPFKYQGVDYNECTPIHNNKVTWCYVKGHNEVPFGATGEDAIRRWGNCKACVASTSHAAGTVLATGLTALALAFVATLN